MIARTFYVIVYLTVSVASAVFFLNPAPNWAALKTMGVEQLDRALDLGRSKKKPVELLDYDRNELDQLMADASDFDAELEFVVPTPVRARRPGSANRKTPAKPAIEFFDVPKPRLAQRPKRPTYRAPMPNFRGTTKLVSFKNAPFPYSGKIAGSKQAFLNVNKDGRYGHRTRSGRLYWADENYNERRSLLHIPKGFDVATPGVMVLYFHGWGTKLERDIWKRQRLPDQITASGTNAVLIAPQFGVDARDSSIGNFWRPGALRDYLDEAAIELAKLIGKPDQVDAFMDMPIVLVGYSGGYVPTAFGIAQGGISKRILGVVLLDALYGQLGTFAKWIKRSRHTFFVSAYQGSTTRGNTRLKSMLKKNGIPFDTSIKGQLQPGSIKIIHAPERHRNYVTQAWAANPVSDILRRLPGLPHRPGIAQRLSTRLSIAQ